MNNYVSKLDSMLSPSAPKNKCNWSTIERSLETRLPSDFKEFWDVFQDGCLGFIDGDPEFLVLHSPESEPGYTRFPDCVRMASESFNEASEEYPEEFPYPFWPKSNGLIEIAHDTNGNEYFLNPSGAHNEWTIIFWDRGGDGFTDLKVGFSKFLWEFAHSRILISDAFQSTSGAVWTS